MAAWDRDNEVSPMNLPNYSKDSSAKRQQDPYLSWIIVTSTREIPNLSLQTWVRSSLAAMNNPLLQLPWTLHIIISPFPLFFPFIRFVALPVIHISSQPRGANKIMMGWSFYHSVRKDGPIQAAPIDSADRVLWNSLNARGRVGPEFLNYHLWALPVPCWVGLFRPGTRHYCSKLSSHSLM